ncbi:selenide, water dikinase SelD [Acidisphaera sp. S103]|uniref:selenide, water dikinase SelD n=1 Tax=Acidisphaera sp. S103 TaxID=1747223 RepID=UPI00131CE044|nr:selenide, water dikinase SelD [Acidisphaera sp. S103]
MQPSRPVETDIVLLGAGHAHVEVLRRFAMRPEPGVRLTLIGREPETPYSGMLPGLIRGDYTHQEAHIDLAPLAAMANARLILAEAVAFDPNERTVTLPGRPDIAFDLLSIDVGGVPIVPGGSEAGIGVKPIGLFLDRLQHLEAALPAGVRVAVVGGGPGGVELALALAERFAGRLRLVLVSATAEPLSISPAAARRAVRQALVDASVELVSGVSAIELRDGRLLLSDGSYVEVATALWATGVQGPAFLAASGVACDPIGCIRVTHDLRSVSHPHIFAAGDCASVEGDPRPKAGVWAVRAGAPLAENLRRAAKGWALKPWKPQRNGLAILGLGRGRAVAWRNGIAVQGRRLWWLKDRIDRRWMRMYTEMRMEPDPDAPMRCGGCGAKVSAEVLAGALATLPRGESPDLLTTLDDAAVLKPPLGKLLVQSVDHFRAFLDDPFVFGQIAAAHALSDLYAMGAEPWTALAIASVPYASSQKMRAELSAMLQGATEILRADGCALIGGHSAEASETALGFSVTGLVDSGRILRKGGLQPGDQLILTKPLGTGIVLAGHMRGNARARWLMAAIDSMRTTNAAAARIAMAHRPRAGTDVTGFGLAGHLVEMLEASGAAAVLRLAAIPALPGARALAAHGIESTLAPDNRRVLGDAPDTALLVDPQTSGGLLLGLPAQRAAGCLQALVEGGLNAAIIGEVEAAQEGAGRIRLE